MDVLARHEAGAIGIQPLLVGPHVAHGNVCQLPPAGKFLGKWELTGVALAGMRVYEGLSSEAFKQGLPGFMGSLPSSRLQAGTGQWIASRLSAGGTAHPAGCTARPRLLACDACASSPVTADITCWWRPPDDQQLLGIGP